MGEIINRRKVPGRQVVSGYDRNASLTTSLSGSNNDLTYTSKAKSLAANDVRVRYVVSGNNTALSVSVSGSDITVNVATDGSGNPTSTASQVKAAVEASTPAAALVTVDHAAGNNGSGTVAALAYTNLSGGTSSTRGVGVARR